MFEKEAKEYLKKKNYTSGYIGYFASGYCEQTYKDAAEFGYNKAKAEVEESYKESLCNSELNLASVTEQYSYKVVKLC